MLRGRIVSANGVRAEDLKPTPDAAWVLQSDRGLTFTGDIPAGSRVVEGQWWGPDYNGPPLVSFEKKLADGLGLKLGDPVSVFCDGCPAPVKTRVRFIAPQAEFTPPVIYSREQRARLVFMVEAVPEVEGAAGLHVGLPVDVRREATSR